MRRLFKPALFGALALTLSAQVFAVEPFYERLLQEGIRAHAEGNAAQAVQHLTLACFGMLEEPGELMACRTHLALAQAAQGDQEGFSETVGRILELESQFKLYSNLPLNRSVRTAFENQLAEWIPYASLSSVEAFSTIAHRQQEQELLTMSLDERRSALVDMLAADPTNNVWQIRMSEVELLDGDYQAAFDRASGVLRQDPELLGAICIRGQARASLGDCEAALVDLATCVESGSRPEILVRQLECRIKMEDWAVARELLDTLPGAERRSPRGRAWNREIKRGERAKPEPTVTDESETEPESGDS